MTLRIIDDIAEGLEDGQIIPYLGPRVPALAGERCTVPVTPEALAARLTAKASVPHKLRNNLTAAAQFIENFKHRKTVSAAMTDAFNTAMAPTALHTYLAELAQLPLIVHTWYDDLPQKALAHRRDWGMAQGVSQTEHFGHWVHYFRAGGERVANPPGSAFTIYNVAPALAPDEAVTWATLLYQPLGSVSPGANFLVSDTDFVEVLTEIDIQTPIPEQVQQIRSGRHFLFLGCRFANQLDRTFARQIMKRSSARHFAVLPEEPTRNEARFLAEQGIERIAMPLAEFTARLTRNDVRTGPTCVNSVPLGA